MICSRSVTKGEDGCIVLQVVALEVDRLVEGKEIIRPFQPLSEPESKPVDFEIGTVGVTLRQAVGVQ